MLISTELHYLICGCTAKAEPNVVTACCPLIIMYESEVWGFGKVIFVCFTLKRGGKVVKWYYLNYRTTNLKLEKYTVSTFTSVAVTSCRM